MAKNKKKKETKTDMIPISNKFTLNTNSNKKEDKKSTKKSTKKTTKTVAKKEIAPVEIKQDDRFTIKTPEVVKTKEQEEAYQKRKSQATLNGQYIGKKAVSGATTGLTGIVDAPIQNFQEGVEQGKGSSAAKNIIKGYVKSVDYLGLTNIPENVKELSRIATNDKLKTGQKIVKSGLAILNNNPVTQMIEGAGRLFKGLDKNAEKHVEKARKVVEKPSEKVSEWAEKDADKVDNWAKTVGGGVEVTTNMLPSIAASIITQNPNVGLATMGISAKGTSTREAEKKGATLSEANDIGFAKGAIEVLTEKMFSGFGKVFGKGALDDVAKEGLNKIIKNKGANYVAKRGMDILGEWFEETVSDLVDTYIDKNTTNPDATYTFKDWLETGKMTALSTIMLNGITGGYMPSTVIENNTELEKASQSKNVQKIIEKELEERLNAEYNGKATAREIAQLQKEVIEDIQKGYISTDTIEKTLGGETYNKLDSINQEKNKIQEQIDELQKKADSNELSSLEEKQKLNDLKEQIKTIDDSEIRNQLNQEIQENIKNDKGLQESYNETNRRSENYTVDLNTIEDEKQRAVYQKAMDSGVLNNSNKTHALVDMIAKISSEKGINFDFTNNEQLEKSGFGVNGRNINGYVTDSGITINLNSSKAINRIVGHELTHTFEGTTLYTELQDSLKDFLGSEWDNQVAKYKDLYKGVKNANIENELTSDLIGDYLFTDENYVRNLSTGHRNLFQKIYDEIKYLYNVATAGSKEQRQLAKVKKTFDKMYNELKSKTTRDTKYSLSEDSQGRELSKEQQEYFKDSKVRDDNGNLMPVYHASRGNQFTVFDKNKGYNIDAFYFTKDSNVASHWSKNGKYVVSDESYNNIKNQIDNAKNYQELIDIVNDNNFGYKLSIEDGRINQVYDGGVETSSLMKSFDKLKEDVEYGLMSQKLSGDIYKEYLNITNPLVVDAKNKPYHSVEFEGRKLNTETIASIAKERGYDGVIVKNVYETDYENRLTDDYIAFNSNQIKNVDNTNPTSNEDIRFSITKDSKGKNLSEAQQEYFKDSKAVDDDGNLEIVYHGSKRAGFTTFNTKDNVSFYTNDEGVANTYSGSSEKVDTRKLESVFDAKTWLKGIDENLYIEGNDVYSDVDGEKILSYNTKEELLYHLKRDIQIEVGNTEAGGIYEGYVNITNPYTLDAKGKNWNDITIGENQKVRDMYESLTKYEKNSLSTLADKMDNMYSDYKEGLEGFYQRLNAENSDLYDKIANDSSIREKLYKAALYEWNESYVDDLLGKRYSTNDIVNQVLEMNKNGSNYDGVIFTNIIDEGMFDGSNGNTSSVYVTFNPNQFKAADNTSPTEDADIRYSISVDDSGKVVDDNNIPIEFYRVHTGQYDDNFDYNLSKSSHNTGYGYNFTNDDTYTKNAKSEDITKSTITTQKGLLQDTDNVVSKDIIDKLNDISNKYIPGMIMFNDNMTEAQLIDNINKACEIIADNKDNQNYGRQSFVDFYNVLDKDGYIKTEPDGTYMLSVVSKNSIDSLNDTNNSLSQDSQGRELTTQQQEYFKDSKARDENGNLIPLYHGTRSDFTIFDINKSGASSKQAKVGFWFTENKQGAENFGNSVWYGNNEKAKAMEVYLDIKNPKIYEPVDNTNEINKLDNNIKENKTKLDKIKDKYGISSFYTSYDGEMFLRYASIYGSKYSNYTDAEIINMIKNDYNLDKEIRNNPEEYLNEIKQYDKYKKNEDKYYRDKDNLKYTDSYEQFRSDIYAIAGMDAHDANIGGTGMAIDNENEVMSKYVAQLKEQGYDGIIIRNTNYDTDTLGKENNQYVAFYPNQIKNVDNLNPTENDDIRYSLDRIPISKNLLTEAEQNELDGLRAVDNSGFAELTPEEQSRMYELENRANTVLDKKAEKMLRSASYKAINTSTKVAENYLDFDAKQKKDFRNQMREFSNMTKDELINADTYNKVKDIVSQYANREYTYFDDTVEGIKKELKHTKIKISDELKNQITDYGYFVRDSKLMLRRNSGTPVDQVYQEYSDMYPNFFDSDVWNEADELERLNDFINHDFSVTEKYTLSDDDLRGATDLIYNKLLDNSLSQQDLIETEEILDKKVQKRTRTVVREELLNKMGITPETIQAGKDISAIDFARTDPIRVNEKVFGWKTGQLINDATVNFTKHQEAERIRFLNQERQEIKDLGIKARSKESELVQKYGEKQYVDKNNEVHPYTDAELNRDVKDAATRNKIKNAARVLRQKYDTYIDKVNAVLTEMGYDEIPKRQDYMRHFVELDDKFSRWGLPFNKESMSAEDLPTDINGLTEFNRPGKSYFASANTRTGLQTTYDAITGIDGYLEGVSNVIYHTESIQRYRALTRFIRENYGREHGLDNVDLMTDEELAERIKDIQDNKLSKYVSWLDEQANSIAGKKGALDRSVERMFGRRIYTALNTLKSQVGSNMTGFNIRSAMTNFASAIQGMSKTQKLAFVKGTVSTIRNIINNDGLIDKSDFLTRRFGSDSLAMKPWQKLSKAGQIFMEGTDYFTSNQIWRSKYYENLSKGMSEQQAIKNADDFAARIMGDRSKGSTAELFNSKTLGFLSQFQLEVNNQWSSLVHDNKMDIQRGNKTALGVTFELGQLFAASYMFNTMMKALTGSDVMIDPIDMLLKIFKKDDDDDSTIVERAQKVFGDFINDLPFASMFTGGRIPIGEAFKGITTTAKKFAGGTDNYGNEISWEDVGEDFKDSIAYWLLPTGWGQIKKTTKGLSMYDDKLPIAGSYTKSGNLRFSAEDNAFGKVKAGLFGQYSSKYAQDYIDSGYKSINSSKLDEMKDLDMNSTEYREYRQGLSAAGTSVEDKLNYISDLDVSDEDKTIMASNVAKKDIDMSEYKKYGSYEEFNYAQKNPAKYETMKLIGGYDTYKKFEKEIEKITADYDRNGKAINNSRKNKVIQYVNSLNLTKAQKAMLIKEQYPSFTQYDSEIASYVNNQNMSFIEKAGVLKQLGFKAYDKQIIEYIKQNYKTVAEQEEELKKLGFKVYYYNGKAYVR